MEQMDISMPSAKRKREEFEMSDASDDNTSLEEINNLLAISISAITANKYCIPSSLDDEFLRLNNMVRAVYSSYLNKCLLANYIFYHKESGDISYDQLKNCANRMELLAVQASLETTLYRQYMHKLISDIKLHTEKKKPYKNLIRFLEILPTKVDVGVQTINSLSELEMLDNIQSVCITSNYEELSSTKDVEKDKTQKGMSNENDMICSQLTIDNNTASPTINSTSLHEIESNKVKSESEEEAYNKIEVDEEICNKIEVDEETCNKIEVDEIMVKEDSQDSLLQHMEDMFCDSDDSSDLMTLIEKHSGVTKANMDQEINTLLQQNSNDTTNIPKNINSANSNSIKTSNTRVGKYSFSYYKEMKSRNANKLLPAECETTENKQKCKANSTWLIERAHQESKMKAKTIELSLKNHRKDKKVKEKFTKLFGESNDEEMSDSPICIEDHLTACKERIAPMIVKHLMPLYKKRRIKDRTLFKVVAKHIADMLIIQDTFPEEDRVSKYVEEYFKNKKVIRTKQDVYL